MIVKVGYVSGERLVCDMLVMGKGEVAATFATTCYGRY